MASDGTVGLIYWPEWTNREGRERSPFSVALLHCY